MAQLRGTALPSIGILQDESRASYSPLGSCTVFAKRRAIVLSTGTDSGHPSCTATIIAVMWPGRRM
jgi:hypothetical protein